jgi:hypothetical protein
MKSTAPYAGQARLWPPDLGQATVRPLRLGDHTGPSCRYRRGGSPMCYPSLMVRAEATLMVRVNGLRAGSIHGRCRDRAHGGDGAALTAVAFMAVSGARGQRRENCCCGVFTGA